MKWRVSVLPKVQQAISVLSPQTKHYIRAAFEELGQNPWAGKPLRDELAGLYSFRVRRYRVVYSMKRRVVTVVIVGVGPRETIYESLIAEIDSKD